MAQIIKVQDGKIVYQAGDPAYAVNLNFKGTTIIDGTNDIKVQPTGSIIFNGVTWPTGALAAGTGDFIGLSGANTLAFYPMYLYDASDTLTPAQLNAAYPTIHLGQRVIGPTVTYTYVGSSNWNIDQPRLGYVPVNKAGDTMLGNLTLNADPTTPLGAATKQYADGTGVTSFNTRTGAVTLSSLDVTGALGFTPGTGSGSVTSVSVTTASGVSGTVANPSTTPAITITLGNIVPTSVATGTVIFNTAGARTHGDYSNATASLRPLIQTNTVNGNTRFGLIPNGTARISSFNAFNSSDADNNCGIGLYATSTEIGINSNTLGTGTLLPINIRIGPTIGITVELDGHVTVPIGLTSPHLNGPASTPVTIGGTVANSVAIGPAVATDGTLSTAATDGFFYIPTCPGLPTGVPTSITGRAPMVIDSTNKRLYIYIGGAWLAVNVAVYG